ncbi:MAG TPA: DUF3300 domain-containing protein [Steroidobacteraceae bacterium]|nr:DUF3300 domain-containing protein [Steroidobacteraceae bacterium]
MSVNTLLRLLASAGIAGGILLAGCGSNSQQQAAAPAPAGAAQTGQTEPAQAVPHGPAPAVTQASWAPDELEKLVSPIALYPDQLVGQILAASVNSQEVLDGGNWLLQNENLKGDQLDAAAQKAGLGPAMRALVQFPQVVDMMCQQIDWTRQLGTAFTSDQSGVLDAVQRLRAQAAQVGNLKSTPQQTVETKSENQKTIIEVKPANPQVIYVPQYNPQVVYTTPPPPPAPASTSGTVSTDAAVAGGLLAFGVGVLIGSTIHNDSYCYPHWGAGVVFVGPRPFYPPAYVYHPVYGPAFHPAYGYHSPPGYRYNYNNINRNVNVNVNNNYFNQYNKNQNLRGATQNNVGGATRNGQPNQSNWKGQSTYAGAHGNNSARPNQTANRAPERVGGAAGTRNPALASNNRSPAVDRGYGDSNRGGGASLGTARDTSPARASAPERPSAPARDSAGAGRPAAGDREHAFSGADSAGSGNFARASSARGNASAGGASGLASRGGGGGGPRRR